MLPMAFVNSSNSAFLMAIPMGLMCGMGQAAFLDVAVRSCPRGLHGTMMMVVFSGFELSFRLSDVVGSALYGLDPRHGIVYSAVLTVGVDVLLLGLIPFIPERLIDSRDSNFELARGTTPPT